MIPCEREERKRERERARIEFCSNAYLNHTLRKKQMVKLAWLQRRGNKREVNTRSAYVHII